MGDERMGNGSTAPTVHCDWTQWGDFTLGFCKWYFCHFSYTSSGVPTGQCRLAPSAQGIFQRKDRLFAHILKYLWKCWRLVFPINQSSTWQLRFFCFSGSYHCILTKEDYHLSTVCLTEIKHNPFPCPPAVHSEIWTPSPSTPWELLSSGCLGSSVLQQNNYR